MSKNYIGEHNKKSMVCSIKMIIKNKNDEQLVEKISTEVLGQQAEILRGTVSHL